MSSVVFNASAVGKNAAELFPTTIGGATKMYRYQHIMPAPEPNKSNGGGLIKTRKYTPRGMAMGNASSGSGSSSTSSSSSSSCSPYNVDQSQSVQRRNARERNRVKQVNNSFARLRQHIPQTIIADLTKGGGRGPHKKISKVDTLRIAVEYIRRLQDLVDDLNGGSNSNNCNNSNSVAQQLNLCLADDDLEDDDEEEEEEAEETSSNSSSSHSSSSCRSSSNSQLAHNLYYSSALLTAAAATPTSTPAPTPTPLQQQQQLQRQQFPNHPLAPITLNSNNNSQPTTINLTATAAAATTTTIGGSISTCLSPTSSFNSSMSFDSGTYEAAPQQLSPPVVASAMDAQLQLKFEPYEHFHLDEEDCTPDDEEILDYISLWQEQ